MMTEFVEFGTEMWRSITAPNWVDRAQELDKLRLWLGADGRENTGYERYWTNLHYTYDPDDIFAPIWNRNKHPMVYIIVNTNKYSVEGYVNPFKDMTDNEVLEMINNLYDFYKNDIKYVKYINKFFK